MKLVLFLLCTFAWFAPAGASSIPQRLSEWGLFERQGAQLKLAPTSVVYDLITPLFSDYASKLRVIRLPPGTAAPYNPDEVLDFPEGTVIAKTFAYPVSELASLPTAIGLRVEAGGLFPETQGEMLLLETRILVRQAKGWLGLPYIWKPDLGDAVLSLTGGRQDLVLERDGESLHIAYQVPNANLCRSCHVRVDGFDKKIMPIGPSIRQLNRADPLHPEKHQLATWVERGMLTGLPPREELPRLADAFDPTTGTVAERARAYLDINCAHCHRSSGLASSSGLLLGINVSDPRQLGICKSPVAAGNGGAQEGFDIEPGNPEHSLLYLRLRSTDPSTRMPEVGRSVADARALALIGEWIAEMSGSCR